MENIMKQELSAMQLKNMYFRQANTEIIRGLRLATPQELEFALRENLDRQGVYIGVERRGNVEGNYTISIGHFEKPIGFTLQVSTTPYGASFLVDSDRIVVKEVGIPYFMEWMAMGNVILEIHKRWFEFIIIDKE